MPLIDLLKKIWIRILVLIILILWPVISSILMPGNTYYDYIVSLIMVYALVAVGLNILIGFTGLITLGQAGFVAIGAYTAGILTSKASFDLVPALIIAGLLSALIGYLLGLAAIRLKTVYLAVVTLAVGVSVPPLLLIGKDLTGGHQGLYVPRPTVFGLQVAGEKAYYYVVLVITLMLIWVAINIIQSKVGRTLRAVRDSEVGSQANGINLLLTRATSFAISTFYAGIAGGLYAHLLGYLGTTDYNIKVSLNFLLMTIVGGAGSVFGGIIGASFIVTITQAFARLPAGLTLAFYGLTIILVILFLPRGLISLGQLFKGRRSFTT